MPARLGLPLAVNGSAPGATSTISLGETNPRSIIRCLMAKLISDLLGIVESLVRLSSATTASMPAAFGTALILPESDATDVLNSPFNIERVNISTGDLEDVVQTPCDIHPGSIDNSEISRVTTSPRHLRQPFRPHTYPTSKVREASVRLRHYSKRFATS